MGEIESAVPGLRLDLNNFDSAEASRSRYVLTSPRSLQSCARLGITPVELLIKSLNELAAERRDVPLEAVRVMHESYEKERTKLLRMCKEERDRIIQVAGGGRWPGSNTKTGLAVAPAADYMLKDHSQDRRTVTESISYVDLCCEGKALGIRPSCSPAAAHIPPTTDQSTTGCSLSLGDLRHSPATEKKLERLTKDISRAMCVTVSERDRKIAALMLVKHRDQEDCLKLCQQEEHQRQEARRREEGMRAEAEKHRRRQLKRSLRRWHQELEIRGRIREQQEKEKAAHLEQQVMSEEFHHRRLREAAEAQRREKLEAAQTEAEERKRHQEKLLREMEEARERERQRERKVAEEKEQRAARSKESQERKVRTRLQDGSLREQLRHLFLQQEQREEERRAHAMRTLRESLQHSQEKRARAATEARQREAQERAEREDEHIRRARLRAELQSVQRLAHRHVLGQLSRGRVERAVLRAQAQSRDRAQRAREHNQGRQICHQRLRESIQREEEALREVTERRMCTKEWRRERLRRQRDQIQEEAHRLALASFHLRERVRQQTHERTFDRMALEAQLVASLSRVKL